MKPSHQPKARVASTRRLFIWWMMIPRFSAPCPVVSGLPITESRLLLRRMNFSNATALRPPVARCSICRCGVGGLELQKSLARDEEPLPVIFLTGHGDVSSSVRAMKDGAVDFLTKPVQGDQPLAAVRQALARDAAAWETRRHKRDWDARYETMTSREREVFSLVVRGFPNKQIAGLLGISERTVKAHRAQVMHKMGVQSPAELGRTVEWLGEFFQAAPQTSEI